MRTLFVILFFSVISKAFMYGVGSHKLLITEFMIYNDSIISDEDGDFSDWIEIFNPGSVAINLSNWSLSDDKTNTKRWYFPDIEILPNQYMLIFASGKNRSVVGNNLHTSFKLSAGDGFLGLIEPDGVILSFIYNSFPQQYQNISYGYYNNDYCYFDNPTPGYANTQSTFVPPAFFSVGRGFYSSPVNVALGSNIPGAIIRYTTNGNYPSEDEGNVYSSPILIEKTTPLRAIVYYNGKKSFNTTHTYIFTNDVKTQSNSPAGYPAMWGPYIEIPEQGNAIADYEMDPEVVSNDAYKDSFDVALKVLPVLSIVTSINNLFSSSTDPDLGGIYYYTGAYDRLGKGWGRLASAEYFIDGISKGFFINCRLELRGGASRLPEKTPKHSFNLEFKSEYGPSKLKFDLFERKSAVSEFDALAIRAGYGNSYLHGDYNQRKRGLYAHDPWLKETMLDMGEKSAHSKFVHLYLNGLYWGIYCISERVDKDFAESYYKGKEDDFDIIKDYAEVASGDDIAWKAMFTLASKGLAADSSYFKIQGKNPNGTDNPSYPAYVSVDNLIDFILANAYGGNNDWDHHNWVAVRNRINPGNGFKFLVWDAERILEGTNDNCITNKNNENRPTGLFKALMANNEFKLEVADHIQSHFFSDGALTPAKTSERWLKLTNDLSRAIICESARWGDYRRDIHQYMGSFFGDICLKETHWDVEQSRLFNTYFPGRTQTVLNQFKALGLYPSLTAPSLSWYGGTFVNDTTITITAPTGNIYYTKDGTDPRLIGGNVSGAAFLHNGNPIILSDSVTIKARVKSGNNWSAIVKANYYKAGSNIPSNLFKGQNSLAKVSIYPNPANDMVYFMFDTPISNKVGILLFNSEGKLIKTYYSGVLSINSQVIPLTITELKPGVYIYKVINRDILKTGKLIIK